MAQVNGLGPSPASEFDVVLNLPGDEALLIGEFGEFIGGEPGQTIQLNLNEGGFIGEFFTANSGSEVNISGGAVGSFFLARSGSEVNISGGTVLSIYSSGTVNVSGGTISSSFEAFDGSVLNISGGTVGSGLTALSNSEVNISGGTVGSNIEAFAESELNISGGTVGNIVALEASVVNIVGNEFFVEGAELETLLPGEPFAITDQNVTLSGLLADGEPFSFDLDTTNSFEVISSIRA